MVKSGGGFLMCFESRAHLAAHETKILLDAVRAHQTLYRSGQELSCRSRFVVLGRAGWVRTLNTRQQIVQFATTGDLLWREAGQPKDPLVALTDTKTIDAATILKAAADRFTNPGIATALKQMQQEARFFEREHVLRLGRMTALERMASFLLESWYRKHTRDLTFAFNVTQQNIADYLGLSVVHVNRTLHELRSKGLINYSRQSVSLLNIDLLKEIAFFRTPETDAAGAIRGAGATECSSESEAR